MGARAMWHLFGGILMCTYISATANLLGPWSILWPLPSGTISTGQSTLQLTSKDSFTFHVYSGSSKTLTEATQRYSSVLFNMIGQPAPANERSNSDKSISVDGYLRGLNITVSNPNAPLELGMDESYTLSVPTNGAFAKLDAKTTYGALRGLESFVQLVQASISGSTIEGYIAFAPIDFDDTPRFTHRGVLLDSARHYLPIDVILGTIDAMAWTKMNALHWHMVDAQSFPMHIPGAPDLVKGAYNSTLVYSASDVTTVVQYAASRGIRVIPEFDMPGHAYSWGIGYPNSVATCPGYEHNINNIPLDPTNPDTMSLVSKTISSMSAIFPDQVFHAGGDEVIYGCWTEDPSITSWMKQKGWTDYNNLMQYFITAADKDIQSAGKIPTHWVEVFDSDITVPSNTIIQVWKKPDTLVQVVKAGLRAILSNSNAWYLNCGFNPTCAYIPWQTVYQNEPTNNADLTKKELDLILGGEAVLFGEYADHTNVAPQLWPRAAAVAERLWSPKSVTDVNSAEPRLAYHRCRVVSRGIDATPMGPGFCAMGPV